jgi:tetratricopeptide (TPR) repeat protein
MRHSFSSLFLFVVTSLLTITVRAQSADEDAIKKALQAETEAFLRRDSNAYKALWIQDPKVSRTFVTHGYTQAAIGAESANKGTFALMMENPAPVVASFKNDNFLFRIEGNMAYVEFDQILAPNDGTQKPMRFREHRIMLKQDGQWKLANQVDIVPESFTATDSTAIENDLNATGYKLLAAKRIQDAVEVFKVNVKLHPQAWNVYDSLGEAYVAAGNKELAIRNYEKSLQLNPHNENGKRVLASLKQK